MIISLSFQFNKQLQINLKHKYEQLFYPNGGYYDEFISNGSQLYQKLEESEDFESFVLKYSKYNKDSGN